MKRTYFYDKTAIVKIHCPYRNIFIEFFNLRSIYNNLKFFAPLIAALSLTLERAREYVYH